MAKNLKHRHGKRKHVSPNGNGHNPRRLQVYPEKRIFYMFEAERDIVERNQSEHAHDILQKYYNSLTEPHQRQLLEHYQKMKERRRSA